VILGAPGWVPPALALGALALGLVVWSYRGGGARSPIHPAARRAAAVLKLTGIGLLLLWLLEPLVERVHARPGANRLFVLVDDSQSLAIRDRGAALTRAGIGRTRAEEVRELLADDSAWQLRAAQDFDLECSAFDARLRAIAGAGELTFAGTDSALFGALARLARRGATKPVAAILLFSDGIATDAAGEAFDWGSLPPVHPVIVGGAPARDVGIARVEVSQTGFEESPVTVRADVRSAGCAGESLVVELRDERGELVESQVAPAEESQEFRFHAPAEPSGVHLYRIVARIAGDSAPEATGATGATGAREATAANNERWAVVDRGSGPYRVLYVSGRPNWEFKFLRRALEEDPEVELVGLVRIARRQPKFTFRAEADRRNQLWDGFEGRDADAAEQYDEPVLMRLGALRDELELRGGFPRAAEDLFGYHAIVVDDLEAGFFTPDQMALIEQFVGRRGGGFLALGGEQSFVKGGYAGTPLGGLLPVYLDEGTPGFRASSGLPGPARGGYELELTREGWLEPWVRLRSTEDAERARRADLPALRTLNRVAGIKPGAVVLLAAQNVAGAAGDARPALAAQRFGKGRAAALLAGDLWRWDLARDDPARSDLGTTWRQLVRWLVADVPRPVELDLAHDAQTGELRLRIAVRDDSFAAARDARLEVEIVPPEGAHEGEPFALDPLPSATEAGTWEAAFRPRRPGPYRARVRAARADGSELGSDEAGWAFEPAAGEFRRLAPDLELLRDLARRTGGALVDARDLDELVADLARSEVPITDRELDPLWHRWWMLVLALACLCTEWGVRRVQGLP